MADSRIHEEAKEHGVFGLFGKEEEKTECDVVMIDQKENKEDNKHSLVEELHHSHSNSSSSSDEEEEGGEKERKTKKKKKEKGSKESNVDVPVQSCQETHTQTEEKKGFLEKIKEKLSGHQKETEECAAEPEGETKEKKGILEKIKEKLPGGQKNGEVEVKDKDN